MTILDRFDVTGQVAIVTGAGRGIGAGCAIALAEVGADVVCAARSVDQLEETAEQIRKLGRRALVVPTDVNKREDLENLAEQAQSEMGRIDILVNNAGGWPPKEALRTSERSFDEAFHFNVTTAFLLTRFCVPRMVETAGGGAIVNISSRAGSMIQQAFAAYGTAKAALSFLTQQLGLEFAPKVRVNGIEVGSVETSALDYVMTDDDLRRDMESRTPMKRLGQVEDVAAAAVYLATPASAWVTGTIMRVDGGTVHPQLEIPVTPL